MRMIMLISENSDLFCLFPHYDIELLIYLSCKYYLIVDFFHYTGWWFFKWRRYDFFLLINFICLPQILCLTSKFIFKTSKDQSLIGVQELVEKVFTEESLRVGFLCIVCKLALFIISVVFMVLYSLQMKTLNWSMMDLVFCLWQMLVQTQMGPSSL